jgi:hypothetical protein
MILKASSLMKSLNAYVVAGPAAAAAAVRFHPVLAAHTSTEAFYIPGINTGRTPPPLGKYLQQLCPVAGAAATAACSVRSYQFA